MSKVTNLDEFRELKHAADTYQTHRDYELDLANKLDEVNEYLTFPRLAFLAFSTGIRRYLLYVEQEVIENPQTPFAHTVVGGIREKSADEQDLTVQFYNCFSVDGPSADANLDAFLLNEFTSTLLDMPVTTPSLQGVDVLARLDESIAAFQREQPIVDFQLRLFVYTLVEAEARGFEPHAYEDHEGVVTVTLVHHHELCKLSVDFKQLATTFQTLHAQYLAHLQTLTREEAREFGEQAEADWLTLHTP